MKHVKIRFDGSDYALDEGQDLDAIKEAAVDAAHAGGGLVQIFTGNGNLTSLLVSASSPIALEERDVVAESDTDEPVSLDFLDYD